MFLLACFITIGTGLGVGMAIARNLPKWEPSDFTTAQTTFVYDIEGNEITKLHAGENRTPINSLNEVPEHLQNAFLSIEDARFYDHWGIDFRALARAVVANIRGGFGSQGASTITQQLVRNAMLTHDKEIERKVKEIILAIQVERKYTKKEIFTHYLNWVYFGHGAYGIIAAADTYFGKELSELTLAESATLAGLVQRPNALSPYRNPDESKRRRSLVLNNMVRYNYITQAEADAARAEELTLPGLRPSAHPFPYFVDYVVDQAEQLLDEHGIPRGLLRTGGLRVYTTMDRQVQRAAEAAFANSSNFPAPRPNETKQVEGAMAIVNHRTGEIKALVGGRDHVTERGLNRATQGLRQPGSAFKPIASYGPALELGYGPGSVLDDVPVEFRFGNQVYAPRNLGDQYRGLVTMREALRRSFNVTAVDLLNTIGVNQGFEFSIRLGIPLTEQDRVLGMALGGLTRGVSPLDMATAYGAFANKGVLVENHAIRKITDQNGKVLVEVNPSKRVVMSEETAFLMTDMLRTAVDSGTGTRARIPNRPVAGKTGTTQLPNIPEFRGVSGNRDAWFAGYTPEYSAAVWVGYDRTDRNHYLFQVYGGNHPAMLFRAAMEEALRNVPVSQFERPSTIVSVQIDAKSGMLPSELTPSEYIITELFAKDHVPTEISTAWVRADICASSGLLASEYCPDVKSKVFLQRPRPFVPIESNPRRPADANLEKPTEICTMHSPNNTVMVDICNHPSHGGTLFRAIIGANGGGCPEEYVVRRAFPKGQEPKHYCNIPEHQLWPGNNMPDDGSDPGLANPNPSRPINQPTPGQPNETLLPISSIRGQLITDTGDNETRFSVSLTWDHTGSSNVEYLIYRSTQRGFEISEQNLLATTKGTSYTDRSNLELNKTYFYKVVATNQITKERSSPSPELAIQIK